MWRVFALTFLLGFAGLGAAQDVGNGTGPSGWTTVMTTALPVNTTTCQFPHPMVLGATGPAPTVEWMNERRRNLQTIHPGNTGACPSDVLKKSETMEKEAEAIAMTCPTTTAGPGMPLWSMHGMFGQVIVYMEEKDYPSNTVSWLAPLVGISDAEWKEVTSSYKKGPWDPMFQVLWENTKEVGLSTVAYNNSDLEGLSKMFGRPVTEPMSLVSVVALFAPAGCGPAQTPWRFCGFEPTTEGPHPGPDPGPGPEPDPGTKKPFGAATRVGGGMGFNFATVSVSSIIIGNLLRALSPNFLK